MKKCPICNAFVEMKEDICPYCGTSFSDDIKEEVDTTNYDILKRGKYHKTPEHFIEEAKKIEEQKIPVYKQENIVLPQRTEPPKKNFRIKGKIIFAIILVAVIAIAFVTPRIISYSVDEHSRKEIQVAVDQQVTTEHIASLETEDLLNLKPVKDTKYIFSNDNYFVFNLQSEIMPDTICNFFISKAYWDSSTITLSETENGLHMSCRGTSVEIAARNGYDSRYDYLEEVALRKYIKRLNNIEVDGHVFEVFETGYANQFTEYIFISEPINGYDSYVVINHKSYYNRPTPEITDIIKYANYLIK